MVAYLRAANVKDGRLDLSDVKEMSFSPSEQQMFGLRRGDILVTEGSGSLGSVGASATWQAEFKSPVCFQNTLLRLRPRQGTDPRFLGWWARHAFADGMFASIATGANIHHLSAERLRSLPLIYASLDKQRAIADYLDTETAQLDELVARRTRLLGLIIERARAAATMLIDEVEVGWTPLGRYVTSLTQGHSPQAGGRPAEANERGLLKLSAVKTGRFCPGENKVLPDDYPVALSPRAGDLLVTRANTPGYVGDSCDVRKDYPELVICDLIYRLRLDANLHPKFAAYCLQHPRSRGTLTSLARGTSQSMVKLRGEDIRSILLPVPSLPQQLQVVAEADSIHQRAIDTQAVLVRQIQFLRERRQALITAAVTGELEIPGAA